MANATSDFGINPLDTSLIEIFGIVLGLIFLVSLIAGFIVAISRGELHLIFEKTWRTLGEIVGSLVGLGGPISSGINIGASTYSTIRNPKLDRILDLLEKQSAPALLSVEAEERVVSLFQDGLGAGLNDQIKIALQSLVEKQTHEEMRLVSLESLDAVQNRLIQASKTASIRWFFNLAIGIGFAVVALLVLKSAVELFSPSDLSSLTLSQSLYIMGVRISLALVITLIAYFFLALYKRSLEDLKHYQNEMTAIGLSATSIGLAYDCKTDEVKRAVAEAILRREPSLSFSPGPAPDHSSIVARVLEKLADKLPGS